MPLPKPEPGLVISYEYLWDRESAARNEGEKARPCVIIVAVIDRPGATPSVAVAPVTRQPPVPGTPSLELPPAVKRHLGLDEKRSWVILNELNQFVWPSPDLRPIPRSRRHFHYGHLPPRLFGRITAAVHAIWSRGEGRTVRRR